MTKSFSLFLFKNGIIDRQQLLDAVKYQITEVAKFERVAAENDFLSDEEVREIQALMEHGARSFEELAFEHGYLTKEELDTIIHLQAQSPGYLCESIEKLGYLPRSKIEEEQKRFNDEQRRIASPDGKHVSPDEVAPLHKKHLVLLFDIAKKYFQSLADISLESFSMKMGRKSVDNLRFCVFLEVTGDLDLIMFFTLEENLAKIIMGNMVKHYNILEDMSMESMDFILNDCLGEMFNIICGDWMRALAIDGMDVNLCPARVEGIGGKSTIIFSQGNTAYYASLKTRYGSAMIGYYEKIKKQK